MLFVDRLSVQRRDDIAVFETGLARRPLLFHVLRKRSAGLLNPKLCRDVMIEQRVLDAKIRPVDLPILDQPVADSLYGCARDRKAQPLA